MDELEFLEEEACRELKAIAQKIKTNGEMSMQDLEKFDKLAHALKCLTGYMEKKEEMEYEQEGMSGNGRYSGYSGRRGRAANGRFVSREAGNSYAEGYSRGYSEAMSQQQGNQGGGNQSGYYPMHPRW